MSHTVSLILLVVLSIVVFSGLWLAIALMLARISGWSDLANDFRAKENFQGPVLSLISARWRYFVIGNIYFFGASQEGLYISVLFPFSLVQPKLLVPWSEIEIKEPSGFLFKTNTLILGRRNRVPCRIAHKHVVTLAGWSQGGLNVELAGTA